MSNIIGFTGGLGKDAEQKNVGQNKLLEFSVANTTGFGDKKVTNWFKCVMWGDRGDKIASYLKKGTKVFVSGELTLKKFEKDGVERISPEVNVSGIEFIGSKEGGDKGADQNKSHPTKYESSEDGDDLPF